MEKATELSILINAVYFSPRVSVKLDTLSKDDLIKFAKKQMAAMQKLKSRCAGWYSLTH